MLQNILMCIKVIYLAVAALSVKIKQLRGTLGFI
jgi:hypothetical protein